MHAVNCSIFFSSFLQQAWTGTANRVKLHNYKRWLDLALNASRQSHELLLKEMTIHVPTQPAASDLDGIIDRARRFEDDTRDREMEWA